MFKQSILTAIAFLSIAATADAKPRHHQHLTSAATISCNDRGCSDHLVTGRHKVRVLQATARTKVGSAFHHRAEIMRRAAVRHTPRAAQARIARTLHREVRQVRVSRERAETGIIGCNQQGCSDRVMPAQVTATRAEARPVARAVIDPNGNAVVVGGRPAGCPHRFCGCEASRYVFGEIRPELNLASNWLRKFPRAKPAPGMAAARSGHVMVLISHAGGNDWLVHDGNSGGGLTRNHVISISRYVIVDPRGTRIAQQ